ncbi:MAG: phosphotransferase [Armatimonadetes bacterium]|nr:phosphotransferase [Armatimonadota bacterium]
MEGRLRPGDVLRGGGGREARILAWHAEGSFARVYRAEVVGGGYVAAKIAKAEVPDAARRLRVEAAALRRAQHPRLVRLRDTGERGGLPFNLLEWVEGITLREMVIQYRRLPLAQALTALRDAAEALAALHRHGLAHGDLRPENLILSRREAILIDLDSAAAASDAARAADIAGLGWVLHLALTGAEPCDPAAPLSVRCGHHPEAVALFSRLRRDASPPLSAADAAHAAAQLLRQLET